MSGGGVARALPAAAVEAGDQVAFPLMAVGGRDARGS